MFLHALGISSYTMAVEGVIINIRMSRCSYMGQQQKVIGNLFHKFVSKAQFSWSALDNNKLSPQAFWLSELEHGNLTYLHCGFGVTQHVPIGQGAAFIPTHRNLISLDIFFCRILESWKVENHQ